MLSTTYVIYLMAYIIAIIYLTVLGCIMIGHRPNPMRPHGEQEAKCRMTRTVGVAMFVFAFNSILYIPFMLLVYPDDHAIYKLLFVVTMMLCMPMISNMMFAVVQRKVNIHLWTVATGAPFFFLALCYLITPPHKQSALQLNYWCAALSIASLLFLFIRFSIDYRQFLHRLREEYSETSERDIVWSWYIFVSFAVQTITFVIYQLMWTPLLTVLYLVFSIINSAGICYCTIRQRAIDLDVVPVAEPEPKLEIEEHTAEKDCYADIECKLKMYCEEKLLFLDPDLTRETLCSHLAINHTYLSMYFRKRGTTYYQFINTLRINYAIKLMHENPNTSIIEIAKQSGFRTQPTFRKVFQEVMGCLPSDVKRNISDAQKDHHTFS